MKPNKVVRRILIGVGILIMILGAAFMYLNHRNRTLSPPGSAELSHQGLTVSVNYSRPSVRDRLIFGTESEEALQPYGKYWRLGANEPTSITIDQDVLFNGNELEAGTYQLYAIPGEEKFIIGVNNEDRMWGATEPNYSLDLFRTEVPVLKNTHTEQHTISLLPLMPSGILVVVEFSDIKIEIPIKEAN
jgi:hypothetical protein